MHNGAPGADSCAASFQAAIEGSLASPFGTYQRSFRHPVSDVHVPRTKRANIALDPMRRRRDNAQAEATPVVWP
jgi:hypothetical protein